MVRAALVDFHCHLDLYPDHEAVVAECERERVYTLAVTTTPKAWQRNHELTRRTKYVRAALGLHPQLVAERSGEIDILEDLLPRTRFVGEIGLDAGPRFYKSIDLQKRVFERVLRACAASGDKILTIHSVRAAKPVLDALEAYLPSGRGRAILHWFGGSASEIRRAVALGCYFSINAEMLKDEKRQAIVASLPSDRILTETDGPFTTISGHPSRPKDVIDAVLGLARARKVPPLEMARVITANLRQLITV